MTLQEISEIEYLVNNVTVKNIQIPNMFLNPYVIIPIVLKDKQYFFEYYWNFRSELVYLSIYLINNNQKKYIISNISLIKGMSISDYIHDDDWNGSLDFTNIDYSDEDFYTAKDISEKFQLIYGYLED